MTGIFWIAFGAVCLVLTATIMAIVMIKINQIIKETQDDDSKNTSSLGTEATPGRPELPKVQSGSSLPG